MTPVCWWCVENSTKCTAKLVSYCLPLCKFRREVQAGPHIYALMHPFACFLLAWGHVHVDPNLLQSRRTDPSIIVLCATEGPLEERVVMHVTS